MPHALIAALAVLIDGVLAGVFVGSGLVEHAAKALPGETWIRYKQAKERVFGRLMPPLLLAAIAASVVAALLSDRRLGFSVAVLLLIGVLGTTLAIHVPLNRAIDATLPDQPSQDWASLRDRWRRWHWVRTALALAGFVAAVLSLT